MSYELNIKMKCLAPLHLGDVKNFLIPPRIIEILVKSCLSTRVFISALSHNDHSIYRKAWYTYGSTVTSVAGPTLIYHSTFTNQNLISYHIITQRFNPFFSKPLTLQMVHISCTNGECTVYVITP